MKRRVTTSKAWIQKGPIAPWMREYIQWLANHPSAVLSQPRPKGTPPVRRGPPTVSERTAAASKFARRKITTRMITDLEQRRDIVEYFDKLRADAQFLAREMMQRDLAENIEARREGLRQARGFVKAEVEHTDPETGEKTIEVKEMFSAFAVDHRAIKGYTDWVPEVAFPKKTDDKQAAPRITINIGPGNSETKALLGKVLSEEEDIQDVEFEVIEPKQLEAGDEPD